MLGVPWLMAYVEEQQIVEMEREQRAREVGAEVCFSLFSCFFFVGGTGLGWVIADSLFFFEGDRLLRLGLRVWGSRERRRCRLGMCCWRW